MLVLSRKVGEEIFIGKDITIKVTGIFGNQCKIGIKAPPIERITRSELVKNRGNR